MNEKGWNIFGAICFAIFFLFLGMLIMAFDYEKKNLEEVRGIEFRDDHGKLIFTGDRVFVFDSFLPNGSQD